MKGKSTLEVFTELGIAAQLLDDLVKKKQQQYQDYLRHGQVALFPGAVNILNLLKNQAKRLFVVTGGSRASSQLILKQKGVLDLFEAVVTIDDVTRGKPDPELFLFTLKRYEVASQDALTIEDSESGKQSSQAANIDVLMVNQNQGIPSEGTFTNLDQLSTWWQAQVR